MAKSKRASLKIFQARIGFHDTVVAAPSQAAALRAWGVHQNLFADHQAWVTDDHQATAAALADPGVPLRRAAGSRKSFSLAPASLPVIPPAPRKTSGSRKLVAKPAPKPPPDRSALDRAEAAVTELTRNREREEARLKRRREDLEAESEAAAKSHAEAARAAAARVAAARRAFRAAGGED